MKHIKEHQISFHNVSPWHYNLQTEKNTNTNFTPWNYTVHSRTPQIRHYIGHAT